MQYPMHGILLFAHGARDPAWARPFEAIAAQMRSAHAGGPVTLAYLELMSPALGDAARDLVQAGCARITVVPLFLGAGGHVRRDLPALLAAVRAAHPGVQIEATPAIGEVDSVVAALAGAALALALAPREPQP